jgi:hypothetical protein
MFNTGKTYANPCAGEGRLYCQNLDTQDFLDWPDFGIAFVGLVHRKLAGNKWIPGRFEQG